MADSIPSNQVSSEDVQRIRDAIADLRRLDQEMIAALRELRELEHQSEALHQATIAPPRWYHNSAIKAWLDRAVERAWVCTMSAMLVMAVVWTVWLACTEGPPIPGSASPPPRESHARPAADPGALGGGS